MCIAIPRFSIVWLTWSFIALTLLCPDGARVTGAELSEYRNHAMAHSGDAERGKHLFFDQQKAACSSCHSVDGRHTLAGPDLATVANKFTPSELIEAVLNPSQEIAVGYETTGVHTKSGAEHQGTIKDIDDSSIKLALGNGTILAIAKTNTAEITTSAVSLMPDGLHAGLSLDEFSDLLAYLLTLKSSQEPDSTGFKLIQQLRHPIRLVPFHDDQLSFENPVWFGSIPGSTNRYAIVEHQTGRIWVLHKSAAGDHKSLFLDLGRSVIEGGTRGLIGLVFHPRFTENGKFYIALHTVEKGQAKTVTIERIATADLMSDSGQEPRRVLEISAATRVHYGGGIQFGPDGFLYIGMGDTGPQGDPQGHGQNRLLLRGKMLRINVDKPSEAMPYAIPPDNPFVNDPNTHDEIWALGLREPWRFSFDPVTGDLWVGDVGQDRFEEITIVRSGENHGWNVYEGFEPFSDQYHKSGAHYVPPVFAYPRHLGVSVTGGYVYRADQSSSFYGVYIFGDYQSRRIWGLVQRDRKEQMIRQIGMAPQRIVSFGTDLAGALYLVGYEGSIYQLGLENARFE